MISSMTAFGRCQVKKEWGMATWEIRSINHRYLEPSIRLPEMLRELEVSVRDSIYKQFKRGKVECTLKFYPSDHLGAQLSTNDALLKQLTVLATEVAATLPKDMARLNVVDLLSWHGVIAEETIDINLVKKDLIELFQQTAEDVQAGRRREGELLEEVIKQRLAQIRQQVAEVKSILPQVLERQREKIINRFNEVSLNLDEQRLEQEMVYFTQKIDVSEEVDRTLSHLAEVDRTLASREAAGRRLDFMMQELNREANTLASKSADPIITRAAVEMKVLIEQIREQVQNIE